ncbi:MAG: ABC transporter substrate-binding protein [Bradymonadia bacterium]
MTALGAHKHSKASAHRRFVAVFLLLGLGLSLSSCRQAHRTHSEGVLVASATLTSAWVRNFNPFSPNALWPTRAGIYEPMMIFNTLSGQYVPWLATSYRWITEGQEVEFSIRKDVRWNDGAPLSAEDVAFTFKLLKQHPALDTNGVWSRLESCRTTGPGVVRFKLKNLDYTALSVLAHQMVVPKHVWAHVEEPDQFINPTPVASGPYTEVKTFRTQLFELGLNPHYWQDTKTMPKTLRMPAYAGNDTVSLALISGDIDWAGHAIPRIEKTYVNRDPKHFQYWFPPLGGMVFLYANTTTAPLGKVAVRRALSHAIDRERIVRIGMSGYTKGADASGLSPTYQHWKCCDESAQAGVRFDRARAAELLSAAGCTQDQKGQWSCDEQPLEFQLDVVNGWTDWIRTAQLIKQDLKALGVRVKVKTLDYGAWFGRLQRGEFELAIGWSTEDVSPHAFYRQLASSETVKPRGEVSPTNWHRYGDDDFDALLKAFPAEQKETRRRDIVNRLQTLFIERMPAIPLFPNPSWGTYSTRYVDGFPNAKKPYAKLSPHADPERLLLMTNLRVREALQ